jgi:glycosyltransferase involved in cell wall biosynthesis
MSADAGPLPRVTAILPAHRAEGFVQQTLDSLAAQTWPALEILAADDASPDATAEILERFAEGRRDTRVIRRETNLGWVANTNDLMARATGEFMVFAFHDDLVAPTYVERLVRALIDEPRAVLAYSDLDQVHVDGSGRTLVGRPLPIDATPFERVRDLARQGRDWHVPNRGVFRASAYRELGGMGIHDAGEYAADWLWLLRLSEIGAFVRVPERLCTKRYMPRSLTVTWERGPEIQAALDRAGREAVRAMTRLGPMQKAALLAYMHLRERGLRDTQLPAPLRRLARRIMR